MYVHMTFTRRADKLGISSIIYYSSLELVTGVEDQKQVTLNVQMHSPPSLPQSPTPSSLFHPPPSCLLSPSYTVMLVDRYLTIASGLAKMSSRECTSNDRAVT